MNAQNNGTFNQPMMEYLLGTPAPMPVGLPPDVVDDRGGWMTDINKGSNLGTDLDFLIQNGLIDPRAFQPVQSYEQAEAPGYTMMQRWLSENSPAWEQYVASLVESGINTTGGIMKKLEEARAQAEEGDPYAQQVISSLPVALMEGDGFVLEPDPDGRPDYVQVRNDVDALINARASDPEFELVDGMPMARKVEDSAATKAAQEAGYYNDPTATYDPYIFAREGITQETDYALGDEALRTSARAQDMGQKFKSAREGQASADRQTNDFTGISWAPRHNNGSEQAGALSWMTTGQAAPKPQEIDRSAMNEAMRKALEAKAAGRKKEAELAHKQYVKDSHTDYHARSNAQRAMADAIMREQLAIQAQAAGRSPFYDEVRARNAAIYGR